MFSLEKNGKKTFLGKTKSSIYNFCVSRLWLKKIISFLGVSLGYKMLPKCEKVCDTYYKNKKVYLSVVAILFNEAPYVKEWIEYHRMLGVERFYIYDNGSTDNVKDILKPYMDKGIVCYHYVPGFEMQNKVYRDAIYKYKNQTRWMAVIDLDEFILPLENTNICEFLKNYEKYPAVVVNWKVFDSNGFETPPTENGGLIIANYTRVHADIDIQINTHIKSIVNPKRVFTINNPHYAYYKNFADAVDENFKAVEGPFNSPHTSNKIRINHYHCKSRAEYMKKVDKWCADVKRKRVLDEATINIPEYRHDYVIQKYVKELKKRMEIND